MAIESSLVLVQPTPLLGREAELDVIVRHLRGEGGRLLTLTGPAGVGKTRLALAAAAAAAPAFPDGVIFVDLSPVRDPDLVLSVLAQRLGIMDRGDRPLEERLQEYLGQRVMLLILDNFEQVLPAAGVLPPLLAAAPHITVLVTSRMPLPLRWERRLHVPPLALPDLNLLPPPGELSRIPSVALFLERAQALDEDFTLTEDNARTVAELVAHLDGLPLAIELAAARTSLLSPQMILERIGERFSLLHWEAQDLPERQQTLRSALAWSYDLLSAEEQILFRRLGVFVGSFALEAVEAIAADMRELMSGLSVVDGLASLVDSNLVQVQVREGGAVFYSVLESMREYALERLAQAGELEAAGRSHAFYYLSVAEQAERELTGPRQRKWFLRVDEKQHNLRAALHWLLDHGEGEPALRLAGALGHFWEIRGYLAEGRRWLGATLARAPTAAPSYRAKALTWLGALLVLGVDRTGDGGLDQAVRAVDVLTEGLELARTAGDTMSIARALTFLGVLRMQTGEWERGRRFLQEAQAAWQEAGHERGIIQVIVTRGMIAFLQGQDEESMELLDEGLRRYRDVQDDWGRGIALLFSLHILARRGDLPRAVAMGREILALSGQAQNSRILYLAAVGAAWLARSHGQAERLARLVGAADSIYQAMGLVASLMQRVYVAPARDALQTRMGPEDLDAALRAGRHLSFPQVTALIGEVLEEALPEGPRPEPERSRDHTGLLSPREQEVLCLVSQGLTSKEIGQQLFLSHHTIDHHLTSIYNKLGVDTRAQAVAVAARDGLLSPPLPR